MLLFHKRDLLVVLTKSDDTVQFSKPIKDILKYQYRYNYKFKLYESGKVTVADDYIIEGETLTVFFGSAYVEYTSSGATYNDGGGSGGDDESGFVIYNVYELPAESMPATAFLGLYIDADPTELYNQTGFACRYATTESYVETAYPLKVTKDGTDYQVKFDYFADTGDQPVFITGTNTGDYANKLCYLEYGAG